MVRWQRRAPMQMAIRCEGVRLTIREGGFATNAPIRCKHFGSILDIMMISITQAFDRRPARAPFRSSVGAVSKFETRGERLPRGVAFRDFFLGAHQREARSHDHLTFLIVCRLLNNTLNKLTVFGRPRCFSRKPCRKRSKNERIGLLPSRDQRLGVKIPTSI